MPVRGTRDIVAVLLLRPWSSAGYTWIPRLVTRLYDNV